MKYYHVDVFSSEPMSGNGLTVVFPGREMDEKTLLKITGEFRQFETVFLYAEKNGSFPLRIFTVEEELEFAGHPLLGTAAIIHREFYPGIKTKKITVNIKGRELVLESELSGKNCSVTMNQGYPDFINTISAVDYHEIVQSLNLTPGDIDSRYPMEVVSTGLPYLLVPLRFGIDRCRITDKDFEQTLRALGAKFVYLYDTATLECRTWDNSGLVEDVATGSAAGPLCAYLVKHKIRKENEKIYLLQGKYVNRPCMLECMVSSGEVSIKGSVSFFAHGELYI